MLKNKIAINNPYNGKDCPSVPTNRTAPTTPTIIKVIDTITFHIILNIIVGLDASLKSNVESPVCAH